MRKEISWKAQDDTEIFALEWSPEDKPTHCITLIHGVGEHIGRYERFASFFNSKSAIVTGFDLRGHGKSGGLRGHTPSWDALLEDLSTLIVRNTKQYHGIPQFIYGHSMGATIALSYAINKKPIVKGIITSAPLISTNEPISLIKFYLAKLMNRLKPTFSMDTDLDPNTLSKDPSIVENYKLDPLVHGKISARLGWCFIQTGKDLLANTSQFSLPLLMMVGSVEKIVSRDDIKQFSQSTPQTEYKVWEGLYHELHNEPEWKEVLDYAENWMTKFM